MKVLGMAMMEERQTIAPAPAYGARLGLHNALIYHFNGAAHDGRRGNLKNTIRGIADAIQRARPDASFTVRFWDGDSFQIGDNPVFVLWFKEKRALSHTLANAFMGFGECYMAGDIEVEGDLEELLRLGWAVDFAKQPVSLGHGP